MMIKCFIQVAFVYFSTRITAKVPLGKGKETSTSNDKDTHEDNDKKTS